MRASSPRDRWSRCECEHSLRRRRAKADAAAHRKKDHEDDEVARFWEREMRQVNKEKQLAEQADPLRERAGVRDAKLAGMDGV